MTLVRPRPPHSILWYLAIFITCLIKTLTGHGDNTEVVSRRDFDFVPSMVDAFHLHLGYVVAVSIAHQGTTPRIGALFVSSYITSAIRHMGHLKGIDRMMIVGGFAVMSLEILRLMGMLQRVYSARGVYYRVCQSTALTPTSDVPPAEDDAPIPPPLLPPHARDPGHHLVPQTILHVLQ